MHCRVPNHIIFAALAIALCSCAQEEAPVGSSLHEDQLGVSESAPETIENEAKVESGLIYLECSITFGEEMRPASQDTAKFFSIVYDKNLGRISHTQEGVEKFVADAVVSPTEIEYGHESPAAGELINVDVYTVDRESLAIKYVWSTRGGMLNIKPQFYNGNCELGEAPKTQF